MRQFSFEKLIVWQKSKAFALNIYALTSKFPVEEKFGLISQLRRCSISIPSNIAEGSGRQTNKDKARFTEIAYSSLLEALNQLIISYELKFISEENYQNSRSMIQEIGRMLNAYRKSQLNT